MCSWKDGVGDRALSYWAMGIILGEVQLPQAKWVAPQQEQNQYCCAGGGEG